MTGWPANTALLVRSGRVAEEVKAPDFAMNPSVVQEGDRLVCPDAGTFLHYACEAAAAFGDVSTDPLWEAVDAGRVVDAALLRTRLNLADGLTERIDPAVDPAAVLAAAVRHDQEAAPTDVVLAGVAADARASLAHTVLLASSVRADPAAVEKLLGAREADLNAARERLRTRSAIKSALPESHHHDAAPDVAVLSEPAVKRFFNVSKIGELKDHADRPLSLPAPPGTKTPATLAGWSPWVEADPDLAAWFRLRAAASLRRAATEPLGASTVPQFGPADAAAEDLPSVAAVPEGAGPLVRVVIEDLPYVAFAAVRALRGPFENEAPGDRVQGVGSFRSVIRAAADDCPASAPWRDRIDEKLAAAAGDSLLFGLPEAAATSLYVARGGDGNGRAALAFARQILLGKGWDRRPVDDEGIPLPTSDPAVWDTADDFGPHGLLCDLWLMHPGFGRHLVADAFAPVLTALGLEVDPQNPWKPSMGSTLEKLASKWNWNAGADTLSRQLHLERVFAPSEEDRHRGRERDELFALLADAAEGTEAIRLLERWKDKPQAAAQVLRPVARGAFGTHGGRVWHTAAGAAAALITRGEILAAAVCGLYRRGCRPVALLSDGALCLGEPERSEAAVREAVAQLFGSEPGGLTVRAEVVQANGG